MQTIGIVLVLIGVGFVLNWGSNDTTNYTFNLIVGGVFIIVGIRLATLDPVAEAKAQIKGKADEIITRAEKELPSGGKIKETASRVEKEAKEGTEEIKESARKRINRIAKEVEDLTADRKPEA